MVVCIIRLRRTPILDSDSNQVQVHSTWLHGKFNVYDCLWIFNDLMDDNQSFNNNLTTEWTGSNCWTRDVAFLAGFWKPQQKPMNESEKCHAGTFLNSISKQPNGHAEQCGTAGIWTPSQAETCARCGKIMKQKSKETSPVWKFLSWLPASGTRSMHDTIWSGRVSVFVHQWQWLQWLLEVWRS